MSWIEDDLCEIGEIMLAVVAGQSGDIGTAATPDKADEAYLRFKDRLKMASAKDIHKAGCILTAAMNVLIALKGSGPMIEMMMRLDMETSP